MPGGPSESEGHVLLKKKLRLVLQNCGMKADREVQLNISGSQVRGNFQCERSIDVVGAFTYNGKKCLLLFECKDVHRLGGIRAVSASWVTEIPRIQQRGRNLRILGSLDHTILNEDFNDVQIVKLCYVFGKELDNQRFQEYSAILAERSFLSWNDQACRYFEKVSDILGEWVAYELYREFNLNFESKDTHHEKAVEIRQASFPTMYLMGIHPGLLLKVGYVLRRVSGKPTAYQRMLSKDRIARISDTINRSGLMLPNVIVLAFDNEATVQSKVSFDGTEFQFPLKYCSAWIIDGQHRVFGFLRTAYKEWTYARNDEYRLPVVAFKTLPEASQNRTFVNINYFQKKINPTLLCDLAAATEDLSNELAWPSLLGKALNSGGPLKGLIKISEFDTDTSITLSSFARYGLLESLLGFNREKSEYRGPLFNYSKFDPQGEFRSDSNGQSFSKQLDLLSHYFRVVRTYTEKSNTPLQDPWVNRNDYALVRTTGLNAQLLVLKRIMDKHPNMDIDLDRYLKPLKGMTFKRKYVAKQGGGWVGFRNLANKMLRKLNRRNGNELQLYGEKERI